ncbi:MAG: PAS domain S-box protein [Bacteroidales bacterium]|nr:PAS domain S-box protein [Bacteroidales bacterium]
MAEKENQKIKQILFFDIINDINLGIQVFDKNGVSFKMNNKQKELLGLPNSDAGIGKFNVLNDPFSIANGAAKIYQNVYDAKCSVHHQYEYNFGISENNWDTTSGKKYFEEYIFPVLDEENNIDYVVALLKDISREKIAETKLKDALKFNEEINQTSPVGIVLVNVKGEIEFANTQAEKTLGLKKSDITSRTYNSPTWEITDFDGNPFPEEQLPFMRTMHEKKTVYNIQHAIAWPNGKRVYLNINASPQLSEANEFRGMVATIEDITDKVLLEKIQTENLKFRNTIIKHAAEGLCVCHNINEFPYVKFTVWNDRMIDITGYTQDEINQKGWYQSLYPDPEIRQKAIDRMSSMREGDDIIAEEWNIKTKHNQDKAISISTSIIKTEQDQTHVMALMTDISEKQKYREAIEKHNKELQELNATKDRFFSIIAHDLRSPIGNIFRLTELLKNPDNNESYSKYFDHLYVQSQKTFSLLENLLEWGKVQLGKIDFSKDELNLAILVNESIDLLIEQAREKEITIINTINENISIIGNKNSIKTIFRNLLSNAIKFTKTNGIIEIQARTFSENRDQIHITVKDNGVGIDEKKQKHLFRIDKELSSKGTNQEMGSGLGLIICKEFIEKNDGKIWVESQPGEGSKFHFTLLKA